MQFSLVNEKERKLLVNKNEKKKKNNISCCLNHYLSKLLFQQSSINENISKQQHF
jgi:hypothetical protein